MAFNHRKLLVELNGTYSSVYCQLSCIADRNGKRSINGCFSTCSFPPLFSANLPPSPPLSYSDQAQASQNQRISPLIIILITVICSAALIVTYYVILVKYCSSWNSSRRRSQPQSENTHQDFLDENHGPVVDHPIWYIATVGLRQSVIDSITVFKYKTGEGLMDGTDCSVCLSEFKEDETLRLLPKCSHAFHVPCIDTWLSSHKNCPLCRAPIFSPVTSMEPNYSNSGSMEVTQVENLRTEIGDSENRIGDETEVRLQVEEGRGDLEISLGNSVGDHKVGEDGIQLQPMRRSVSMDSSSAAMIYRAFAEGSSDSQLVPVQKPNLVIVPKRNGGNSNTFKLMGSPSVRKSLQKGPMSMKRSFSCGGKFLLSRYSRSRNSILPL